MPREPGFKALPPGFENFDVSDILGLDIPTTQKRAKILERIGVRKPRQKYASPEARKKAQAERAKLRRKQEKKILEKFGVAPKPKKKKTKGEKKEYRKRKATERREFLREAVKLYPDLARQYGINPERMKK